MQGVTDVLSGHSLPLQFYTHCQKSLQEIEDHTDDLSQAHGRNDWELKKNVNMNTNMS